MSNRLLWEEYCRRKIRQVSPNARTVLQKETGKLYYCVAFRGKRSLPAAAPEVLLDFPSAFRSLHGPVLRPADGGFFSQYVYDLLICFFSFLPHTSLCCTYSRRYEETDGGSRLHAAWKKRGSVRSPPPAQHPPPPLPLHSPRRRRAWWRV